MTGSLRTHSLNTSKGRRLWPMPGGIHPPENKQQSSGTPIRQTALPEYLIVPLQQHIGAPATPLVQVGETVLKGQKIADASGVISTSVHAPSSGVVEAIGIYAVADPSQPEALCIRIKTDGNERWIERKPVVDFRQLEKQDVLDRIRDAGITGLGGAGFPTAAKLNVSSDKRIEQLILNAAECEPYITADDRLLQERADQVIAGLLIMAWLVEPKEILIGIEDNKPRAIEALRLACADAKKQTNTNIELAVVPTQYPSGGEKQLIQILTGKEVPSGGLPADIGVLCQNVGTAYAVKRAIIDGEPLISRITTVTGAAIAQPGNYEVLVGTPIEDVLQQTGIQHDKLHRLVMGGPMMGFSIQNPAAPVVKVTNCLLAATVQEFPDPAPEQACIRCGACSNVCPASLLPQQLYWYTKAQDFDEVENYDLFDCIECGACAYVCPSAIPLVQYYRYAKNVIRAQRLDIQKADRARGRFEARTTRLEREQRDKESKRQERAKAAAARQSELREARAAEAQVESSNTGLEKTGKTTVEPVDIGSTDAAQTSVDATSVDTANTVSTSIDPISIAATNIAPTNTESTKTESAAPAPAAIPQAVPVADSLAKLQTAAASTLKRYKDAQKALDLAEKKGVPNLDEMRAKVDQLKAKADAAKDAFQTAKPAQDNAPKPPQGMA